MKIRRARLGIVSPLVAGLVMTACGDRSHDGMNMGTSDSSAYRIVNVEMTDLKFSPAILTIKTGETVKFVFDNRGAVQHDAFVGDAAAQRQHAMGMSGGGDSMAGHNMGTTDAITVQPGKAGELTMTFKEPGTLEIGCHEPGHYEAGMKATVVVS